MAQQTATAPDHTPGGGEAVPHDHPTPKLYVQVAAVLFVLTAMEFSTYFIEFGALTIPLLVVLMAIKFVMVAGFFMHLKYDTRLFTRLMATGLIGALGLYFIALLALAEIPRNVGL
jgi:cytochrome c oxidase subunit 4